MDHAPILAAEAILLILCIADWRQTLQIARHPELWYERNPILGKHPSVARVHAWFALCLASACAATWALWARPMALCVLVIVATVSEARCVVGNLRLGIKP